MLRRNDADLLGHSRLFAGLDAEVLAAIAAASIPRPIRTGQVLFRQGDEPPTLHVLAQGRLKIARTTGSGNVLTIRFLGPGEVPGCVAAIRHTPYPATATAVADSRVLTWSGSYLGQLMVRHPRIATNALDIVGGQTEEMLHRLQEFTTEPVDCRIARVLLRLASQAGQRVGTGVEVSFPLSRQDIAELAGTTLHTVSRTLSGWERDGVVSGGRQRVVINDTKRLERIGAGHQASQSPEVM